jgi:hypothetical protein
MQYLSFVVWLISLSIMLFTHCLKWQDFFTVLRHNSITCVHIVHFHNLSVNCFVLYLNFYDKSCNEDRNSDISSDSDLDSSGYIHWNGLLGHKVVLFVRFENTHTVSHNVSSHLLIHQQCSRVPFPSQLHQHCLSFDFCAVVLQRDPKR